MLRIGQYNTLVISRQAPQGVYLEDEEGNEVLLPNKYVPKGAKNGQSIEVFLYLDGEERPVATTLRPLITLGQFAALQVVDVNDYGAYLDWGLEKNLFVPYREQSPKMQPGKTYLVHLDLDEETGRLVASSKIHQYLDNRLLTVKENEEVELIFWQPTDLGYNVVVNGVHKGLVYSNEIFVPVHPGDRRKGWIKKIREENKLDIALQRQGYGHIEPAAAELLDKLRKNGGFLPVNDDSDPEKIYDLLGMSKKTFKKSVGALYKKRLIRLGDDGIYLEEED